MHNMNKVLWFSRHNMTDEQVAALGNVEITKINVANMPNVHVPLVGSVNNGENTDLPPFKELVKEFDVIAIVLPINLESQVLSIVGDKPVIRAENKRVLVPQADGTEDKVVFQFNGWKRLVEIKVVLEDFLPLD